MRTNSLRQHRRPLAAVFTLTAVSCRFPELILIRIEDMTTPRWVSNTSAASDRLSARGQLVVFLRRFVERRFPDLDDEHLSVEAFPSFTLERSIPCTTTPDS